MYKDITYTKTVAHKRGDGKSNKEVMFCILLTIIWN